MNATIEFPTLNYGDTLCVSILSVYIYTLRDKLSLSVFGRKKTRKYFRKVELTYYFRINTLRKIWKRFKTIFYVIE